MITNTQTRSRSRCYETGGCQRLTPCPPGPAGHVAGRRWRKSGMHARTARPPVRTPAAICDRSARPCWEEHRAPRRAERRGEFFVGPACESEAAFGSSDRVRAVDPCPLRSNFAQRAGIASEQSHMSAFPPARPRAAQEPAAGTAGRLSPRQCGKRSERALPGEIQHSCLSGVRSKRSTSHSAGEKR